MTWTGDKQLGLLLQQADENNRQKVHDTWPEYWAKYKDLSEGKKE